MKSFESEKLKSVLGEKESLSLDEIRELLNSKEQTGLGVLLVLLLNHQTLPLRKHIQTACLQVGLNGSKLVATAQPLLEKLSEEVIGCQDIEVLTSQLMRKSHYQF